MAKKILVVGASGGIGRAVAERLGRDGCTVLAHGRRGAELERTLDAVRSAGGDGRAFEADLADMDQVARLAEWASEGGSLDGVVFCAGGGASTPVADADFEAWDAILDVILRAPMRLAALTLPAVAAAQGSYVFVCGIYAKMGVANRSVYCAGRHGMVGFAESMFEEVRERGVGVTLVHPGFVNTSLAASDRVDPALMIQTEELSDLIATAIDLPKTSCVVEMTVRPQRSPYRK